jgi:hypothetical protein
MFPSGAQSYSTVSTFRNLQQCNTGKGLGIYTGDDGFLYCDALKVEDCRQQHLAALATAGLPQQPMYLYSKAQLAANFMAYREAMADLPHIIGYAVKANNNLSVMRHLCSLGSGAVLVSGNELKHAKAAGFDTTRCGNNVQQFLVGSSTNAWCLFRPLQPGNCCLSPVVSIACCLYINSTIVQGNSKRRRGQFAM